MKRILVPAVLALAAAHAGGAIHSRTGEGGLVILSNIPAPDAPRAPRARPVRQVAAPAPAAFPRVGADEQRARDADRRAILQEELVAERQALDGARGRNAPPDQLRRHQHNIEALQRELASVR
jgi:hypothetical protein